MRHLTPSDVRQAFDMYKVVCHDPDARLTIERPGDGARRFAIINGKFKMHALGPSEAVKLITTWVDGYNSARDEGRGQGDAERAAFTDYYSPKVSEVTKHGNDTSNLHCARL